MMCVRFFLIVVLAQLGILTSARGDETTTLPEQTPPEMEQDARDWLDSPGSEAFGKWLMKVLNQHPEHPEWLAMFADILQGSDLGPTDGWFRKAVAQTRYDWKYLLERYDKDGDGIIERVEFPGSQKDFDCLDRDSSGTISSSDLEWPEHALARSPGSVIFRKADTNSDGHITRDEWLSFFDKADTDRAGFLSLDDLRSMLPNPPPPSTNAPDADEGPSKSILIRALFHQELGALKPGIPVGEAAADFTLKTADGQREITLSKAIGPKPVVLVFGNITCGPFRSQAGNIEKLYHRYRDRATFLMVYVREAHPTNGWHMTSTDTTEFDYEQPKTYEQRVAIAQTCQRKLNFEMPFLVDTADDAVSGTYSGMPGRLYVIDRAGKVAYRSGRGPYGFKPAEMEQSLIWTLIEDNPTVTAADLSDRRPAK